VTGITTRDGLVLRVARWVPADRPPRGTVCILQGRAEFIEKYFEVVGELLDRGFAVVAFDWRGQGHSGRQVRNAYKGYVRTFAHYRRDLEAVRDQVLVPLMPGPHFALAHSMGGAIALHAAYEGWLPFQRLVAVAPMVALCMVTSRLAPVIARLLSLLGFGRAFVPGGGETSISKKRFKGNRLTSDPVRYARNANAAAAVGSGAIGDPAVAWVNAAFRFMRRFADPRYPIRIRLPILIVGAGADPVCATPAAERFASRLKAGRIIVLPGARHEILMERDEIREDFWAAFDAFIPGESDQRLAPEPPAIPISTRPAGRGGPFGQAPKRSAAAGVARPRAQVAGADLPTEAVMPGPKAVSPEPDTDKPASGTPANPAEAKKCADAAGPETPADPSGPERELAPQEPEGGVVDPAVAGRHDRAPAGG
jgi:lysophospholipase